MSKTKNGDEEENDVSTEDGTDDDGPFVSGILRDCVASNGLARPTTATAAVTVTTTMTTTTKTTTAFLTVDDAMDRIGYGRFQRRMLVAVGLCSASDAMEVLILSFLSLSVQKEWDLTSLETSSLISSVFGGAFVGTLLLGRLGDIWGRRPTFLVTAAIVAGFGMLSAGCTSYWQLLMTRTMVGVGIGGVTVPFDTYAECLPTYCRGKGLVYPSYFWTVGTMLVIAGAKFTLQEDGGGWRYLCLWCAVPCIMATWVGYLVVPESPQWLLAQCRHHATDDQSIATSMEHQRALTILRNAATQNGIDPDQMLPTTTILVLRRLDRKVAFESSDSMKGTVAQSQSYNSSSNTIAANVGLGGLTSFHDTMDPTPPGPETLQPAWKRGGISVDAWKLFWQERLRSAIAIVMIWFGCALLYYGTVLAITAVFTTSTMASTTSNTSLDGMDDKETAVDPVVSSTPAPSPTSNGSVGRLHFDFGAILFSSLAEVVAATFVVSTLDRWGRKKLHVLSFGLGGVFILFLCLVATSDNLKDGQEAWLSPMLAFGGRFWVFSGSTVTWIWTAEIFETQHRTTWHGLANAGGRVGGFLSPYLVSPTKVSYSTMGWVLWAVSCMLAAIAWSSLPETLGMPMGDAVGDKEDEDDTTMSSVEMATPICVKQKNKAKDGYRLVSLSSSLV